MSCLAAVMRSSVVCGPWLPEVAPTLGLRPACVSCSRARVLPRRYTACSRPLACALAAAGTRGAPRRRRGRPAVCGLGRRVLGGVDGGVVFGEFVAACKVGAKTPNEAQGKSGGLS